MSPKRIVQARTAKTDSGPLPSVLLQRQTQKKAIAHTLDDSEAIAPAHHDSRFRANFASIPVHSANRFPGTGMPFQTHQRTLFPPMQAKLTIGQPKDKYEQEADRVAAQVVQQINTPASTQSTQGQSSQGQTIQRQRESEENLQAKQVANLRISPLSQNVQRETMEEDDEQEPAVQAKAMPGQGAIAQGGEALTDVTTAINDARGGGQPLEPRLQKSMGQAMGADFSGVRVHTDARSDQLNRLVQAKAFTTGQDVFFRQGAYEPGSRGGQQLIAHELTHVVQQQGPEIQQRRRVSQKITGDTENPQISQTVSALGGLTKSDWTQRHITQPTKTFKAPLIVQLRRDKRVEPSARNHYDDKWGVLYGIQNDNTLKGHISDTVKTGGTKRLGDYVDNTWQHNGDDYRRTCFCSIKYNDRSEGRGKYKSYYTSIFHCGPGQPKRTWKRAAGTNQWQLV